MPRWRGNGQAVGVRFRLQTSEYRLLIGANYISRKNAQTKHGVVIAYPCFFCNANRMACRWMAPKGSPEKR